MTVQGYVMTEEQFWVIEQQSMALQALADITCGGPNDMIEYGVQREHLSVLFQSPAKTIRETLNALPFKKITIE